MRLDNKKVDLELPGRILKTVTSQDLLKST